MRTCLQLVESMTGKVLVPQLRQTETRWEAGKGLLGSAFLAPGEGLFIPDCGSIHTFFMRFAIDVLFLNRDGIICKQVANLRPWRFCLAKSAWGVIELPAGTINQIGFMTGMKVVVGAIPLVAHYEDV